MGIRRMAALFCAGAVVLCTAAWPHSHWIRDGKYLDPVTGQHCCDQSDCRELDAISIGGIFRMMDGSLIVDGLRFIKGQQHKSEDGKFYRCFNRCVFLPVEG